MEIPSDISDKRIYFWKDFMDLGRNTSDDFIYKKLSK
jgi:hypothetical protein